MNVQKILVPTDLSVASEPALSYAVDLAKRFGAKVTFLHVYALPIYPMLDGAVIPAPQITASMMAETSASLEKLRSRFSTEGLVIDGRVVQGSAADTITQSASDERFDLIVMGTHGHTGFRRLVLGSIAEYVARTATIPVVTVHSGPREKPTSSVMTTPPVL